MSYPIQIAYLNMQSSEVLAKIIQQLTEKLSRFYPRITNVKVAIEMLAAKPDLGNTFQVRIDITVPGQNICVETKTDCTVEYRDVTAAVRDAFLIAVQKVEEYAKQRLNANKTIPA